MHQLLYYNKKTRGVSIIEILISLFIFGVALAGIINGATILIGQSLIIKQTNQATTLAQELLEATRSFRDSVLWNNDDPGNQYDGLGVLNLTTAYHLQQSADASPKWQMIQGAETLNGFTRQVVFTEVLRDSNSNVVVTGGVADSNIKKATATVSWMARGATHQVQLSTYITNWM